MNEPILVFRKKNSIMILSFLLLFVLFTAGTVGAYLQKGVSVWLILFAIVGSIVPLGFIVDNVTSVLYVHTDHFTIKGIKYEKNIPFSKIHHISCRKEDRATRNEHGTIEQITPAALIFTNQQNKKVIEIEFSFFQTKEELVMFLTFFKQYYPNITFDADAQNMLQETTILPKLNPYIPLIFMIVSNIIVISILISFFS